MRRETTTDDLPPFLETVKSCGIFERGAPITVTRAPGRLDVMGGIADYSGALVLQRPIAEATFTALQRADQPVINVVSLSPNRAEPRRAFSMNLAQLSPAGEPIGYSQARKFFQNSEKDHWAAYVVGAFLVLITECGVSFQRGANILVSSTVPEGKGVASSAALEVAAMQAITAAFGIQLEPEKMALLCQKVENMVAGAPCGVMDQMASVCGKAGSLLALLCQPAELQPSVPIPEGMAFWGLDSGERHAVSGSDYGAVRTGAFMGLRMISEKDSSWNDYLANISPSKFEREYIERLPEQMSGKEFLDRYSGTTDTVTFVEPTHTYRVRQPTAHPVYEHHRVNAFRDLLLSEPGQEQLRLLGELMYQSHASYSACGLGSRGTDLIVDLVREQGRAKGLYGARITGGGSGGTVAILGRTDADIALAQIVQRYEAATGYRPQVFSGSSDGTARWGVMVTVT